MIDLSVTISHFRTLKPLAHVGEFLIASQWLALPICFSRSRAFTLSVVWIQSQFRDVFSVPLGVLWILLAAALVIFALVCALAFNETGIVGQALQ